MGLTGLEPVASPLSGVRSSQLSYRPQSLRVYDPRRGMGQPGRAKCSCAAEGEEEAGAARDGFEDEIAAEFSGEAAGEGEAQADAGLGV